MREALSESMMPETVGLPAWVNLAPLPLLCRPHRMALSRRLPEAGLSQPCRSAHPSSLTLTARARCCGSHTASALQVDRRCLCTVAQPALRAPDTSIFESSVWVSPGAPGRRLQSGITAWSWCLWSASLGEQLGGYLPLVPAALSLVLCHSVSSIPGPHPPPRLPALSHQTTD